MENSKVKLATMIAAIVFCLGGGFKVSVWMMGDALWKQRVEYDILQLRKEVSGADTQHWNHKEMRRWTDQLEDKNPELAIPNPDAIETVFRGAWKDTGPGLTAEDWERMRREIEAHGDD